MATNLRLDDDAVAALRAAAQTTGRSQQDLLREAVDRYLGLRDASDREEAIASGLVRPPSSFVHTDANVDLPPGTTTLGLLDRDDR